MTSAALNPNASLSMSQLSPTSQMHEHVVEACRLVASRHTVRGVHIVAKGQLTTDELRQLQDYAATCRVTLTVDTHGMISIRSDVVEEQ